MKREYRYLLYIFVALIVTSCSLDDVSVDNGTDFTEKNLVQDKKSANAVLNGVYDGFRQGGIIKGFATFMVSGTGQVIVGDQYNLQSYAKNNIQPKVASVSDEFYKELSYIINLSNYLITQVEANKAKDLSEERKAEILGEAKTLRAFARFMLFRTYGQFYDINSKYGIVVSNKPIKAKDKYSRKTVKEVYNAIITDLKYGINNCADTKMKLVDMMPVSQNFNVTKTTAKAFLAKVYLYKKDYTKAEQLSKEVMFANTGGYMLEPTYAAIYSKRWESMEVLFTPHIKETLSGFSALDPTLIYDKYDITFSTYFKDLANKQVPSVEGNDEYTVGYDPRVVFANKPIVAETNRYNKYPFDGYETGNTIYYMRMAEVYLIYAEAAARNNHLLEALEALNMVRMRANFGITPPTKPISPISSTNKADILNFVRQEKMLELFLETGESWFDLIRYINEGDLTFETVKKQKKTLTKKEQLTYPIPLKAMDGSDKLVQNPGY